MTLRGLISSYAISKENSMTILKCLYCSYGLVIDVQSFTAADRDLLDSTYLYETTVEQAPQEHQHQEQDGFPCAQLFKSCHLKPIH